MKYVPSVFICFIGFFCSAYYTTFNAPVLSLLFILFGCIGVILLYLTRIESKIDTLLDKDKK